MKKKRISITVTLDLPPCFVKYEREVRKEAIAEAVEALSVWEQDVLYEGSRFHAQLSRGEN